MQYFLGFDRFSSEAVFDPSLFVLIRKGFGDDDFDQMNQIIIAKALNFIVEENAKVYNKDDNKDDNNTTNHQNSGKVQFDATITDADIKFPTDLSLLNDSREKSEKILGFICKTLSIETPRTYKRVARASWLNLSKSKKKSYKQIQIGIKQQLNFLHRNLNNIYKIIDNNETVLSVLDKKQYKYLLVIKELYRQQLEMYQEKNTQLLTE